MKKLFWNVLLMTLPAIALVNMPVRADEPAKNSEPTISVTPIINYVTVKGDKEKFREDLWMKDQWSGGVDEFTLDRKLGDKGTLSAEGRAIFDQHDYKLHLEIANPDIGFIRAGYTEFRKYFDGTGGFFSPFSTKFFELTGDQHLDIRDVYFEAGLTLPNWPTFLLGYERKAKRGEKSMIEWGSVVQGATTRKIYPAFKDIDDTVDIFKAEVEHNVSNVHVADQFRYEYYRITSRRLDDATLTLPAATPSKTVIVDEHYSHDAFFNTFLMDSHVNEKVYWSAGYLFNKLNGKPSINVDTMPIGAPSAFNHDKDWQTHSASVDQNSHVLNANAMFGPFFKKSTYCYGGIQAEKTKTDGRSLADLFEPGLLGSGVTANDLTGDITTRNDKDWFTEQLGLRFVGIPFTTLYAEGKWEQGNVSLFEEQIEQGPNGLLVENGLSPGGLPLTSVTEQRLTDANVSRENYRIGFNTAPVRRINLSGYYRHNQRKNNYSNLIDQEILSDGVNPNVVEPQEGYSAFITSQKFTTDEIGAKLTVRPISRVSASFKYQLVITDIDTSTAGATGVPAGAIRSGKYDASVYTVSTTVTPINRLYLTGLVSFQDTRTFGYDNGSTAVIPYRGNVYTVLGSAGYALDDKTDLTAEYSYSRSDNFTDFSATGQPYGLSNHRHTFTLGLARRLTENLIARFRYGYYEYRESSNGGIDNYQAHLASASCTVRF